MTREHLARAVRYAVELALLYRVRTGVRRSGRRRPLRSTAAAGGAWHQGLTRDVSASGVRFTTVGDVDDRLVPNAPSEMKVLMPMRPLGAAARARCVGRVVRILATADRTMVTATIDRYRLEGDTD